MRTDRWTRSLPYAYTPCSLRKDKCKWNYLLRVRDLEGSDRGIIKVLPQQFPGGTVENHEALRISGRYLNRAPLNGIILAIKLPSDGSDIHEISLYASDSQTFLYHGPLGVDCQPNTDHLPRHLFYSSTKM
jgi:hypothetical protein